MVERYVMEVGSGARELVERLRQWDGCWPAPCLDHDVERAADTITALSERCRVLEEAIHDADQTLMLLGDTGWRRRHRAALAGGRG